MTKKQEKTTAVTAYNYGTSAGTGMDDLKGVRTEVPFINQLQSLSPECEQGGEKQIPNARPGLFINSVTREMAESLDVVIASVKLVFNEWRPRNAGGGFVASHEAENPIVAKAKEVAKKTDKPWLLKFGDNDLVETYVVALVLLNGDEPTGPAVMTFTKTKIRRLQQALARMSSFRGSKDVPIFAHGLTLKATREKNKAGQAYFNMELVPRTGEITTSLIPPIVGDEPHPVLAAAQILREAVASGDVGANFSAQAEENGKAEVKDGVF